MTEFDIFEERISIKYYRSTAPSMRAFLTRLRDDAEIVASTCGECGHVEVPPRDACPDCGAAVSDFEPVTGEGEIVSWTRDADGEAFGVVRLDGTDSGFLHRILDDDVETGNRVRAVFADDPEGRVTDIEGFEVIG